RSSAFCISTPRGPSLNSTASTSTRRRPGRGIGAALLGDLHRRLPAAATYILMVLEPNTGAIRFYQRHGLEIERETDAVSHYKDTMGFVPPDTQPVPALIMRYRRLAADVTTKV